MVTASYVTLGSVGSGPPADLKFGASTSFSVSLWLQLTNFLVGTNWVVTGDLPFIGNSTNAANAPGWVLCPAYQTGSWQWCLNDGTNNIDVNGSQTINDNNWHHFLLTVDRTGAVADSYLDGVHTARQSIASLGGLDYHDYYPIAIGQDPRGLYGEPGSANVDDIGIWRRALTPTEAAIIASTGSSTGRSFDSVGPIPLGLTRSGGSLILTFGAGTLLQSTNLGPTESWTAVPGATAPSFTITPSGTSKYYRVQVR